MTASEMEAAMLASGKADHDASEKKKLLADRVPFDQVAYMDSFPELLPHSEGEPRDEVAYLLGFSFTPKTALAAPTMFFNPLFFGDHGHLKGKWKGVIGVVGKLDGAGHWVPTTFHYRLANEDAASWGALLEQSKRADPSFDTVPARIITDGDKGLIAAHLKYMSAGGRFLCSRHRRENILKNVRPGGAATVAIYDQLVRKPTRAHPALKRQLSAEGKNYLGKVPDHEQYMAEAEHMHGQSTSNAAESMMAANASVRLQSPLVALRQHVGDSMARYNRAAAEMVHEHKKGTVVPPRVAAAVKPAQDAAHRYTAVTLSNANKTRGTVGSATTPGGFYNCNLVTLTCDCGQPEVTGLLCVHLFALATKGGHNWVDFLPVANTMYGWRMQYAATVIDRALEEQPEGGAAAIIAPRFLTSDLDITVFEFPPIPSEARISDLVENTTNGDYISLLMPPAIRRARGRPASQKRKRGALELTGGTPKRKPSTCSNCQRLGHKKNSCTNLPRLAAPPSGGGTPTSTLQLMPAATGGGGSTSSAPAPLSASLKRTPLPPMA